MRRTTDSSLREKYCPMLTRSQAICASAAPLASAAACSSSCKYEHTISSSDLGPSPCKPRDTWSSAAAHRATSSAPASLRANTNMAVHESVSHLGTFQCLS